MANNKDNKTIIRWELPNKGTLSGNQEKPKPSIDKTNVLQPPPAKPKK